MSMFSRFSPLGAFRDLRAWLASRKLYEVGFMALSIAITWTVIQVFARDTHVEPDYKPPEIVYVQNWRADRSDAEIKAQQAIDLPKEKARAAAITEAQRRRQEQFKKIDDKLKAWGI